MFFYYYYFLINFPRIQVQGFAEHFMDNCGGVIRWINQVSQSIAFAEGWGLYAEMLIADDTDSYDDNPWQKYGALKWRVGCFFCKGSQLMLSHCKSLPSILFMQVLDLLYVRILHRPSLLLYCPLC